jgi:hypothetical protein
MINPIKSDYEHLLFSPLSPKMDDSRMLLTVNFRQPRHEFSFNVGIDLSF